MLALKLDSKKSVRLMKTLKIPTRAAYDQFGHAGTQAGGMGGGMGGGFSGNFSDIFEDLFGDFGGRSGQGSRQQRQSRGSDLRAEMEIDFKDAYFGTTRDLMICLLYTSDAADE